MLLRDVYVGDAPPVPTGVVAPRGLRLPRYTRVIPVLDKQRLAAALREFEWKHDQCIRECQSHPRYDHWRGWERTPAAIEPADAMGNNPTVVEDVAPEADDTVDPWDALNEPAVDVDDAPVDVEVGVPVAVVKEPVAEALDDSAVAVDDAKRKVCGSGRIRWRPDRMLVQGIDVGDSPPVPTGVVAPKVVRHPKYTTKIPVLSGQRLNFALRRIDEKHDKLARQYRQRHLEWLPDEDLIKNIFVGDLPPIPTGVVAKPVLRRPRYTRVIPLLNDQQLTAALLEFDLEQNLYIHGCRAHPRYDHWRGWVRTPAAIEPVEAIFGVAVVEEPIADPAIAVDDDPVTEEEVVPVDVVVEGREEPDDALDAPPDEEVPMDDSEDPVGVGLLQHDLVPAGEGEEEPLGEVVPAADEEPDDALNDPPDVEQPMDDSEEPVDDGFVQHDIMPEGEDQDVENAELPDENVDPVDIVVVARNEEKVARPVSLRRSPRLGGVTGSVFLSSNTGRVVRRSARIMSRR